MPKTRSGESLRSANRLLDVMAAFRVERPTRTMSDIAQELGLAVSTVRRLLITLVQHGLLEVDPATNLYSVSPRTVCLLDCARSARLIHASRAVVDRLNQTTGESVVLAVLDGPEGVHIDARHGQHFVAAFNPVGYRVTLHRGGSIGKVLLAWLPEPHVRALLPSRGAWKPPTPRAIHTTRELLAELARVREQGYATNDGATHEEVWTVAAPVRDPRGVVVAALMIPVPQTRATTSVRNLMIRKVVRGAGEISAALRSAGNSAQRPSAGPAGGDAASQLHRTTPPTMP